MCHFVAVWVRIVAVCLLDAKCVTSPLYVCDLFAVYWLNGRLSRCGFVLSWDGRLRHCVFGHYSANISLHLQLYTYQGPASRSRPVSYVVLYVPTKIWSRPVPCPKFLVCLSRKQWKRFKTSIKLSRYFRAAGHCHPRGNGNWRCGLWCLYNYTVVGIICKCYMCFIEYGYLILGPISKRTFVK